MPRLTGGNVLTIRGSPLSEASALGPLPRPVILLLLLLLDDQYAFVLEPTRPALDSFLARALRQDPPALRFVRVTVT